MEPEGSLTMFTRARPGRYPEPDEFNSHPPTIFLYDTL
jgi:hypothetical protein